MIWRRIDGKWSLHRSGPGLEILRGEKSTQVTPAERCGAPNCTEVEKMSAGRGLASRPKQAPCQDSPRRLPAPSALSSIHARGGEGYSVRTPGRRGRSCGLPRAHGVLSHDQRLYTCSTISPRFLYASVSLQRHYDLCTALTSASWVSSGLSGGRSTIGRPTPTSRIYFTTGQLVREQQEGPLGLVIENLFPQAPRRSCEGISRRRFRSSKP